MLSARWTWLTLIACAAAAQSAGAQQAAAAAAAPPEEEPQEQARAWRLPPFLWTGSLAYDLRMSRASQEASSRSQLVTGNLGLKTYIYQPWLAVVTGNVGLTSNWSSQSSGATVSGPFGTDASLHEQIRSREQFLTGNARVDVFPQSRFPFEAHVERNDSRIDSGLASTFDFQTTNFGFSQRYRPVNGTWTATGAYDHREQSGQGFRAKQDTFNGDYGTRWKFNELNLSMSQSRARSVESDDDSRFGSLVARHNYVPSSALSINSTANWTRTQERAAVAATDLQVLQWSSVGLWRREGSPLALTGSARALHLREDLGGTALDSGGLTLGANYEYNKNLRLTANTGFNTTRSADHQANGFTGTVGAAYQGDTLSFADVRYNWFASGSLGTSLNQGSDTPSEQQTALNLQLGHTATRSWALGQESSFSVNAAQTLAWTQTRSNLHSLDEVGGGKHTSLLNTLAATWQTGGGGRTAYLRTSYSDSMELQGGNNRFQLFNFQLSGNYEIDNRRSFSGDLTFQRTWQSTDTLLDGAAVVPSGRAGTMGASGEVTYQEQRVFGVPRLRFISRLKLAQDVLKQPGTLLSLPDRETRLWENRLDWSVGRLDTQLILRLSQVDGRNRQSLMFRIQRMFGG